MTTQEAIKQLQTEHDLIAGERDLDGSQFAPELLEALDVGIDAIMEQIGVTIHINIRDAEKEEVMKMFDKYGLIERILYGKKTEEKGSVTCVNQEKMHDKTADDIISRRALLKQIAIDSSGSEGYYGDEWKFIETIKNMPSVQPERKRGHWVINSDGYYPYCSECRKEPKSGDMTDFCPNCGADMRGKNNGKTT